MCKAATIWGLDSIFCSILFKCETFMASSDGTQLVW